MTTPLIAAHHLHRTFPGRAGGADVPALRDVSLHVRAGEMVGVVGPSGSGKSTLLYGLAGLEPLDAGRVSILGRDLGDMTRGQLAVFRRDHLGFVFQSFNLLPSLSAWENVALPARLARRRPSIARVDAALDSVGLRDRAHHLPGQLSGGQQQRVAVARVLAMQPQVVFADEPTGALDTRTGAEVLRLLRESTGPDRSVVLVTHDLEAAATADRVLVLRDGALHAELVAPSADEVFRAVASLRGVA